MIENFKKCFSINLNDYENIGINLEINKVLLPAFIMFALLVVLLAIYRDNMRDVVVQLFRHDAIEKEKACTLEELGLSNNRIIPYLLSRDNLLTKVVGRVGKTEYSYEEYKALSKQERREAERIDFSSERFFIREEYIDRARHIKEKYETGKVRLLVGCLFLFLVYIAIAAAMPELLNLINNLLKRQ